MLGAMRILGIMTKGVLRQTKHLSPFKRKAQKMFKKGTAIVEKGPSFVGEKELRPFAKSIVGKEGLISKIGGGAEKTKKFRSKTLYGYQQGYKHLRKQKKLYGSAVAGGVFFDMFDDD